MVKNYCLGHSVPVWNNYRKERINKNMFLFVLFFCCQRLVSMVADGIYIHSLHNMKLLHVIPGPLLESTVCVLSPGMPVLGHDTQSYLAYSDSGDMKIFHTVNLVGMQFDID